MKRLQDRFSEELIKILKENRNPIENINEMKSRITFPSFRIKLTSFIPIQENVFFPTYPHSYLRGSYTLLLIIALNSLLNVHNFSSTVCSYHRDLYSELVKQGSDPFKRCFLNGIFNWILNIFIKPISGEYFTPDSIMQKVSTLSYSSHSTTFVPAPAPNLPTTLIEDDDRFLPPPPLISSRPAQPLPIVFSPPHVNSSHNSSILGDLVKALLRRHEPVMHSDDEEYSIDD
jgi:hypothetical protein